MSASISIETETSDAARERKYAETIAWVSKLKTPWLRDGLLAELEEERARKRAAREGVA